MPEWDGAMLDSVTERVASGQRRAVAAANQELLATYWGIGRDMLVHQTEGGLRERAGQAITNFDQALPPSDSDLAQQATRDPYLFDLIGGTDLQRERDLERSLVEHVERFLLELGQGFAFVGQQVRLELGGDPSPNSVDQRDWT